VHFNVAVARKKCGILISRFF